MKLIVTEAHPLARAPGHLVQIQCPRCRGPLINRQAGWNLDDVCAECFDLGWITVESPVVRTGPNP